MGICPVVIAGREIRDTAVAMPGHGHLPAIPAATSRRDRGQRRSILYRRTRVLVTLHILRWIHCWVSLNVQTLPSNAR